MAFERHVAEFNAAPDAAKYEAVVGGCACHMRSCPGPLERIAKRTFRSVFDPLPSDGFLEC